MTVPRFAVLGLSVLGIAACAYASARLIGWVPAGKLAPYPAWAAVHLVSAAAFAVVAPLQLWPRLRTRRPRVHRALGRTGVAIGVVMTLSGLALVYDAPARPLSELIFMTVFSAAYLGLLALGLQAALARDFTAHRAWMVRMTACAFTPVTQRLVFPGFAAALGIEGLETFWQIFVSAAWIAWAVNMTAAEVWLRGVRPLARPLAAAPG